MQEVKELRYIPKNKATLYFHSIYNYTSQEHLEEDIRTYLQAYYRGQGEVLIEPELKKADLFLELEVDRFVSNELPVPPHLPRKTHYLISVKATIMDVQTRQAYVEGAAFHTSCIQEVSSKEISGYNEEVKRDLFAKIGRNLDHLIRTGNVRIQSHFGYEGLEDERETWLDRNWNALRLPSPLPRYGIPDEEQGSLSNSEAESHRRLEIDRRDRYGNK